MSGWFRENPLPLFESYIGIDYSGAQVPVSSLKGLRVYAVGRDYDPLEVPPPPSPRKYWNRKEIAEWLLQQLLSPKRFIIGIDHGFSFPLRYFDRHGLPYNWPSFLEDFQRHWPTDGDNTYVCFVRDGARGNGAARTGDSHWRRLTEVRAGGAKSVFHFDVPGSVATSTHAGLPWLLYLRRNAGERVHFWPFDGFEIPPGKSVIVEVYPSLWSAKFSRDGRTSDQHDAYSVAAWLKMADSQGALSRYFDTSLNEAERRIAQVEGWILGVSPVPIC